MKTLFQTLILTFLLLPALSFSQNCTRPIEAFMAAPGGYSITGSAVADFTPEGNTLSIDSAFGTQSGPDLHVYLSINFEAPTAQGNTNIDLGPLTSNTGAQSYTIPSEVGISDYNYVLVHCKSFNHWWGGGLLGDISCVSAVEPTQKESSTLIYPNPAADWINIQSPGEGVEEIMITDVLGKIRITQKQIDPLSSSINVSTLEQGMFFVVGTGSKGKIVFQKTIIRI